MTMLALSNAWLALGCRRICENILDKDIKALLSASFKAITILGNSESSKFSIWMNACWAWLKEAQNERIWQHVFACVVSAFDPADMVEKHMAALEEMNSSVRDRIDSLGVLVSLADVLAIKLEAGWLFSY